MNRLYCFIFIFLLVPVMTVSLSPTLVLGSYDEPVDYLSDDFYSGEEASEIFYDPLEPMNRAIFTFNDTMYIWVMEPVATVYSHIIPTDLRICINSFFRNLQEPVRLINTLLQGRFSDSYKILGRFVINSTLGIYGLADAARNEFGIAPIEATMGETFETWGVGDGVYLVMPLWGPTTLREFSGDMIESAEMTPYYSWTENVWTNGGIYLGKKTNSLSLRLGEYEEWKKILFDPYISFRNAYFQYRRKVRYQPTAEDQ